VMRQELQTLMEDVDILALPTTPSPAFGIEPSADELKYVDTPTSLTLPFNVLGNPAISVPCGFSSEGMPIGLTLVGRHWEDDLVLRAAYTYEQQTTRGYTPPPIAAQL